MASTSGVIVFFANGVVSHRLGDAGVLEELLDDIRVLVFALALIDDPGPSIATFAEDFASAAEDALPAFVALFEVLHVLGQLLGQHIRLGGFAGEVLLVETEGLIVAALGRGGFGGRHGQPLEVIPMLAGAVLGDQGGGETGGHIGGLAVYRNRDALDRDECGSSFALQR